MALDIDQIAAISYPAVLQEKKKPENQWAESAAMKAFDRFGYLLRKGLADTIEAPIDYRRNPGAKFLQTDLETMSLAKTEVISAAVYSPAQLSVPVEWANMDDVKTPAENQKIAFVDNLLSNGMESHDDLLEEAAFVSDTNGFIGLPGLILTSGEGTVGGINATDEVFWRNPADTYQSDGSDFEAVLNTLWMQATKGSGSSLSPKNLFSGEEPMGLFESTQTPFKRYEGESLVAGFKTIAYKTALWVFSQYGDDKVYGVNPRSLKFIVSKQYFRHKGATQENDDANGKRFFIYSACQMVVNNKSRLFVASEA